MRILKEYNGDERLLCEITAEKELSEENLGKEGHQKNRILRMREWSQCSSVEGSQ